MKKPIFSAGLALALVVAATVPMAAHAQVTRELVVGQTSAPTAGVTQQTVDGGDQIFFHITNPTGGAAMFTMPNHGVSLPVPPNSDRTFYFNMANVTDREIPYVVTGPGGQQLASGVLINEDAGNAQSIAALQSIINYSTAYSAPIDPEPTYYERPAAYQTQQPIRGYW